MVMANCNGHGQIAKKIIYIIYIICQKKTYSGFNLSFGTKWITIYTDFYGFIYINKTSTDILRLRTYRCFIQFIGAIFFNPFISKHTIL